VHIGKGFAAGLVATLVLSALMVVKTMVGLMPQMSFPGLLAALMGAPGKLLVGWIVHFMIGVIAYGTAIAWIAKSGRGNSFIVQGVLIAVVGWLTMMAVLMPMAGAGLFGLGMGIGVPVMTLVLHLIFGAVLGWMYGRLALPRREAASAR
jgi:hypothetical protein